MSLILNPTDYTATYQGTTATLTPREFQILRYLVEAKRPVKGPELTRAVFGEYYRNKDTGPWISRIRKKLNGIPEHGRAGYVVVSSSNCPTCGHSIG